MRLRPNRNAAKATFEEQMVPSFFPPSVPFAYQSYSYKHLSLITIYYIYKYIYEKHLTTSPHHQTAQENQIPPNPENGDTFSPPLQNSQPQPKPKLTLRVNVAGVTFGIETYRNERDTERC